MIRIMILDDEAIYLEKEHTVFLPEKELNTELKYFRAGNGLLQV